MLFFSGLAIALWLGGVAPAQTPPPPLSLDLVQQVQLNPEQIKRVCDYVAFYAEPLKNATEPGEVEDARKELVRPFNQPNAARLITPNFRGEYSKCLVPAMEQAIAGGDDFKAVNAVLVLSQLATDRSLNVLLAQLDGQAQERWQIRMHAANAIRMSLQGGALDARKIADVARRLRDAIGAEQNGLVVRHQIAVLNAADSTTLEASVRAQVRGFLVDAIAAVAARLAGTNSIDGTSIDAVSLGIASLRDKFVQLPTAEQQQMGTRLGPAIANLFTHALAQWDQAHADTALGRSMSILVAGCDAFLQFIDARVRGEKPRPPADLRQSWEAGDKAKFETSVNGWKEILTKAPYKA